MSRIFHNCGASPRTPRRQARLKRALTCPGQDSHGLHGSVNSGLPAMSGKRAKTQQSEVRSTTAAARPAVGRRMFAREVPALDLSRISLLVVNDNDFLRSYMERLFGIMRVGNVATDR